MFGACVLRAEGVVEAWRLECNEETPKKSRGGLPPAAYARQLAGKAVTLTPDSKVECY